MPDPTHKIRQIAEMITEDQNPVKSDLRAGLTPVPAGETLVLVSDGDVAVLVSNTRNNMHARRAAYYAVYGEDPDSMPTDDTVRAYTRVMDVHRVDAAYA